MAPYVTTQGLSLIHTEYGAIHHHTLTYGEIDFYASIHTHTASSCVDELSSIYTSLIDRNFSHIQDPVLYTFTFRNVIMIDNDVDEEN